MMTFEPRTLASWVDRAEEAGRSRPFWVARDPSMPSIGSLRVVHNEDPRCDMMDFQLRMLPPETPDAQGHTSKIPVEASLEAITRNGEAIDPRQADVILDAYVQNLQPVFILEQAPNFMRNTLRWTLRWVYGQDCEARVSASLSEQDLHPGANFSGQDIWARILDGMLGSLRGPAHHLLCSPSEEFLYYHHLVDLFLAMARGGGSIASVSSRMAQTMVRPERRREPIFSQALVVSPAAVFVPPPPAEYRPRTIKRKLIL